MDNLKEQKVVVVTGGSKGFGKALAKYFVAGGYSVVISGNNRKELKDTAKELVVDYCFADVTFVKDVKKLGEYVFKKYGTIDVWVNNAGIQIAPILVENIDIKKLHYLFDVNFFGYFYGCQVALIYMKKKGEGIIVNINSTAGLEGKPNISAYASSKFAIKGLTESIRKEVAGSNIKVCEVFPGGMQTEIYKDKSPIDIKDYMDVDFVAKKVVDNLQSEHPEIDLIIRRPIK